jgi:hypothetical protein
VCYGGKLPDKQVFGKMMTQALAASTGIDYEMKVVDYYTESGGLRGASTRSRSLVVKPVMEDEEDEDKMKMVFDIWDFLNDGQIDEKGKDLGSKPHINNVKGELF